MKTGTYFNNLINNLLNEFNIPFNAQGYNPELINNKLAEKYNVQIHIFSPSNSSFKIASYPSQYNPNIEQIYLSQTQDLFNSVLHYDTIINLTSYFNDCGKRYCFDCGIITTSKDTNFRHTCNIGKFCLSCRRKKYDENYWHFPSHKTNYCDQDGTVLYGSCSECNLSFKSEDCSQNHRKTECRRGIMCKDCKKYLHTSGIRPRNEILLQHTCGEKFCKDCHTYSTSSNHICQIKKQALQHDWNKAAFLTFNYLTKHSVDERKELKPVQACLIYESGKAGNFETELFHDGKRESDYLQEGINFTYWPPFMAPELNSDGRLVQFGKKKKKTLAYGQFKRDRHRDVAGSVLQYLLTNDQFQNTTVVMQSTQELLSISSALLRDQIVPQVLRTDNTILEVSVKDSNIRFIDFNNYQGPITHRELVKEIYPDQKPIFFIQNVDASKINSFIHPKIEHFNDFNDNPTIKVEKQLFLDNFGKNNTAYNIKDEGLDYLYIVTKALALFSLNYVKQSLFFQLEIIPHLGDPYIQSKSKTDMPLLNPLCMPFVSLGSYVFGVFRLFDMNKRDIKCIPNEHTGLSQDAISRSEAQLVYYLVDVYGNDLRCFHNHVAGQDRSFRHLIPDAYNNKTKLGIFANGCYWHSPCPRGCLEGRGRQHPPGESFDDKLKRFKITYPDIKVLVFWECQIKEFKQKQKYKDFIAKNPWAANPPTHRLIPRSACRGGHSETYNFFFDDKDGINELFSLDVNSQYPAISINNKFPTGDFHVLIGEELKDVKEENNTLIWNGEELRGLIFLTIDPPEKLLFPYLLLRTKNGRSVASLCSMCAEKQVLSECNHTGVDRYITATYTTLEINYALKLGYKIVHIYEIWHWQKEEAIFRRFMQLLIRKKLQFSGFPNTVISEDEKNQYCQSINANLLLPKELFLMPEDVRAEPKKRKYYKLLANSLLGKVSQSNLFPRDIYVTKGQSFYDFFYSNTGAIDDFDLINETVLYLKFKPNKQTAPINRSGNCVLTAFITAHGRQHMHESIMKLDKAGCVIYSVEADSLVFSKKKGTKMPLDVGFHIGQFTQQYSNITHYSTLGPKTSNTKWMTNGYENHLLKYKGLNLNGMIPSQQLCSSIYDSQVKKIIAGIKNKVRVTQTKRYTYLNTLTRKWTTTELYMSNDIMRNRKLFTHNNLQTIPYGFPRKAFNTV